jgi:uncharacterized protein (DUF736 family)
MSNYDNNNRGVLFKNDKKDSESQPDYKGSINADGFDFWLSAWVKTDKTGKKYMSLSISPKEQPQKAVAQNKQQQKTVQEMDSDIPF